MPMWIVFYTLFRPRLVIYWIPKTRKFYAYHEYKIYNYTKSTPATTTYIELSSDDKFHLGRINRTNPYEMKMKMTTDRQTERKEQTKTIQKSTLCDLYINADLFYVVRFCFWE